MGNKSPIYDHLTVSNWLDKAREIARQPSNYPKARLGRVRGWAVAELIYSSGLRLAHVAKLKTSDFDPDNLTLRLGDRIVPVTSVAALAMSEWLFISSEYWQKDAAFLFAPATAPHRPMGVVGLETDLRLLSDKIGLPLSAVDLKRAFIREMVVRGFEPKAVAYLAGLKLRTIENMVPRYS